MSDQLPIHTVEVPSGDIAEAFQLGINAAIHDAWQEGHRDGLKDALRGTGGEVLAEIAAERERQNTKWGEQNHPNGTGPQTTPMAEIVRGKSNAIVNRHYAFGLALQAKSATDSHAKDGTVTFADILLEEVFEALAEEDPAKLRAELVQVAAVAAQWVEAIDRGEQ